MAIYRTVQKGWEAKLQGATKVKKLKLAKDAISTIKNGNANNAGDKGEPQRKSGGSRAKGGPAAGGKGTSLGLAATLSREKDWWSSGILD